MSSEGLSTRAASLLRTLVDMHIREGQPVGSKALHVESGLSVSPATIRNVMSDLEERGYFGDDVARASGSYGVVVGNGEEDRGDISQAQKL